MAVRPYKDKVTGQIVPRKWILHYYIPGGKRKMRYQVLCDRTEAEAYAIEAECRRTAPEHTSVTPRLVSVVDHFYEYYKTNRQPLTYEDVKKSFKHILKHFGNDRFLDLNPIRIEQYKGARLADGVCKRTIIKELSYFSRFLGWAAENNFCNPITFKVKKFDRVRSPKPEIPSPESVQAIIDSIEPVYLPIMLLLYDGGLRRSEAMTLQTEKVNLTSRLMIVKGKGGKERIVPIVTERLYNELARCKEKSAKGFLFINPHTKKPYYSIRKALIRAATKAGVEQRVYHHLLRHSFGTHATVAGVGLRTLQDVMGHSSSQTTELYTTLAAASIQTEMGKFANYTAELSRVKPVDNKRKSKRKN